KQHLLQKILKRTKGIEGKLELSTIDKIEALLKILSAMDLQKSSDQIYTPDVIAAIKEQISESLPIYLGKFIECQLIPKAKQLQALLKAELEKTQKSLQEKFLDPKFRSLKLTQEHIAHLAQEAVRSTTIEWSEYA